MSYTFKNKILILTLLVSVLTGCGYKSITTQTRDIAYLHFSVPNSEKYTVTVNETQKFDLVTCKENDSKNQCTKNEDMLYEVKSGQVTIMIIDSSGHSILKESMYLGAGNTKEISL